MISRNTSETRSLFFSLPSTAAFLALSASRRAMIAAWPAEVRPALSSSSCDIAKVSSELICSIRWSPAWARCMAAWACWRDIAASSRTLSEVARSVVISALAAASSCSSAVVRRSLASSASVRSLRTASAALAAVSTAASACSRAEVARSEAASACSRAATTSSASAAASARAAETASVRTWRGRRRAPA